MVNCFLGGFQSSTYFFYLFATYYKDNQSEKCFPYMICQINHQSCWSMNNKAYPVLHEQGNTQQPPFVERLLHPLRMDSLPVTRISKDKIRQVIFIHH